MKSRKTSASGNARAAVAVVSMTGFGRAREEKRGVSVDVEVKSVNSRFLDCSLKLPRQYGLFEAELRELVAARVQRGRVEVNVSRTVAAQGAGALRFDKDLFQAYAKVYQSAAKELGAKLPADVLVREILARREVLDTGAEAEEPEAEKALLWRALEKALDGFEQMRRREGNALGLDMSSRVERLRDIRQHIAKNAAQAPVDLKQKLEERMRKLLSGTSIDEGRLYTEAALLADRVDVSEELVRLESHFQQFVDTLRSSPNGRKLEFLLQEFGREFNTINSKAQGAETQKLVVEAKTEIEKLREQVQNVE